MSVSELAVKDFVVLTGIFALDRDASPNLRLSINWDKSRFEKDRRTVAAQEEWKKTFTFTVTDPPDGNSVVGTIRVGDSDLPPCPKCSCETDGCPSNPIALDHETFDTVLLTLTVIDDNTALNQNYDEVTVTIQIVDANDNDPVFDPSPVLVAVENSTSIKDNDLGYVLAVDADADSIVTYSVK